MTLTPPPERPLPDPEAVLRRVLDEVAAPGRRAPRAAASRWVLPLVAAVVVALVALGAIGLLGGRRPSAIPAGPPTGAASIGAGRSATSTAPIEADVSADGTITWRGVGVTLAPSGSRRPALSQSMAVTAWCGRNVCRDLGVPQAYLGLATTKGSGTSRADGSFAPLVDRALAYALQWPWSCSPSHMPGQPPSTIRFDRVQCFFVALVDAGTGRTLFEFETSASVAATGGAMTVGPTVGRPPAAGSAVAADTLPLPKDQALRLAFACIPNFTGQGQTMADLTVLGSANLPSELPPSYQGPGPKWTILFRMVGGVVVACNSGEGRVIVGPVALTREAQMPTTIPTADAGTPVKVLLGAGTGGASGSSGGTGSSLTVGTWFVAAPEVAAIRTRVTVGGVVGPWVVSSAANGFVYRRVSIPSIPAAGFVAETEVITRDGRAIDVAGVTGRTTTLG